MDDYYVNGSPTKSSVTPLQNVTNGITLNTRGLPPAINRAVSGFGAMSSQPSTSQRLNIPTKKIDKTWRKTIPQMVLDNGNRLVASKSHPLQLNERSANVNDVTNELKKVNIENPILIDSFFLEIGDSNLSNKTKILKTK